MSIWKLKNLIFFPLDLNLIFFLLSSWRKILKLVKSLKDLVMNEKQRWLLLFIYLLSLNAAFVQIDCPLMSIQLIILFKSTTPKMPNILLFNIDFFAPFNFFLKQKYWTCRLSQIQEKEFREELFYRWHFCIF